MNNRDNDFINNMLVMYFHISLTNQKTFLRKHSPFKVIQSQKNTKRHLLHILSNDESFINTYWLRSFGAWARQSGLPFRSSLFIPQRSNFGGEVSSLLRAHVATYVYGRPAYYILDIRRSLNSTIQ